jgi:trk system potassium uptake protein TrkH
VATGSRGQRGRRPARAIFEPPAPGPGTRANARRHSQIFVLGLVAITLVGTVLLALPWVTRSGNATPLVDALFTSTSAASVTGLSVVNTFEHWNLLGQIILLVLVQTGGLGFTVGASILLQMLRRGSGAYTLRDEMLLKDGSPALSIQEAVWLAGRIIRFTIICEAIGAAFFTVWFIVAGKVPPLTAIWNGVFYAVTAFCNAGFDLSSGFQSVRPAATDVWLNLAFMVLIQFGALSYMVCADVARARTWSALALDSKIVLSLNALLLVVGATVFLAAEWGGALIGFEPGSKLLASLFQSVSARSAGFSSIDWALVHPLTLFFWLGLMFIGGASGSTSGGVRLSTVGVVLAAVSSTLRGNAETQIWGRRIATPLIFRAVTVIAIFLLVFGLGTVLLSVAEHHLSGRETGMIDLMFEAMSALATTGVSTGITPALSAAGKLVLCALMFVGHLGPLITVYALQRRQHPERYRFPEEAVRIG